jgi:para-aminobenzoate synthetase/4-amino-4-deoxychorismate lyase
MRVRVLATAAGTFSIEAMPLASDFGARAVRVALADSPIDSADVFLYHKTTVRDVYEQARTDAEDVVLYNERGEITESTIANIAILRDGTWVTPPVSSGLLPGTMRAELLALGSLQERIIRIDDLRRADAIKLFNSVRGEYPATVTGI